MSKEFKVYFQKRFYKDKKGYYVNSMPIHAQRWVWINHFGTIPDNMDVHHKDGDKSNNEIENLEIISRSDHLKKHWKEGSYDLDQRRKQLSEARLWLKTPQGKKKQAINTKNSWEKRKLSPYKKICIGCEISFESYQKWGKHCNSSCYAKWRRKNKIGFIEKKCWICDKVYSIEKSSKIRTCGKECGTKLQIINQNK